MTDKKDTNDFDFDFDDKPTITEQDIKAANNMRENIKKQNTINDLSEKESEERVKREIAKAQWKEFDDFLNNVHEPYSLAAANEVLEHLAYLAFLNSKTFWSFALIDGRRTKIEQIQYFSWAVKEVSKSKLDDKLKILIMEIINSYIGELVFGKVAWSISLSL